MKISEALDVFLVQLDADGRSPHTRAQYARHIRLFDRWLLSVGRDTQIANLGPDAVAAFLASPGARHRATDPAITKRATSVNALRSSLRNFGAFLERADLVVKSPTRLVRRALAAEPQPRAISDTDIRRLLDSLDAAPDRLATRDRVLIRLLFETGARISSVLGLDVGDIDLATREVSYAATKNGRELRLPISQVLRDGIHGLIGSKTTGPLLTTESGSRLCRRHATRILWKRLKEAGVSKSTPPHGFRHAFAMRLYERTGDIAVVQMALGHRAVSSTLVYARPSCMHLSRALHAALSC